MLRYRKAWLSGAWGLVALVIYLSLMPAPPQVLTFDWSDKFEHGLAYTSMSWCFCQLYRTGAQRIRVVVALIAMGIVIEILQGLSGYRFFEYADILANSVGVWAGFLLARTALGRAFIGIEELHHGSKK